MSDWKRFQDRVAELEPLVHRAGYGIESPARLVDRDTGQPREIDVLVRVPYGGRELLVMIECRRRRKVPDVTWIEQLSSKRQSVGADHVIAVSSTGFTEPARTKAQQLSVHLRTLADVTAGSLLGDVYALTVVFHRRVVDNVTVEIEGGPRLDEYLAANPQFRDLDMDSVPFPPEPIPAGDLAEHLYSKVLFDERRQQTVSLWELFADRWPGVFDGLRAGEPPVHRSLTVDVDENPFVVHTMTDIPWYFTRIRIELDAFIEDTNLTPTGSLQYEDDEGVLVKRLEYDLRQIGEEGILTFDMLEPNEDGTMPCLPRVVGRRDELPAVTMTLNDRGPAVISSYGERSNARQGS